MGRGQEGDGKGREGWEGEGSEKGRKRKEGNYSPDHHLNSQQRQQ